MLPTSHQFIDCLAHFNPIDVIQYPRCPLFLTPLRIAAPFWQRDSATLPRGHGAWVLLVVCPECSEQSSQRYQIKGSQGGRTPTANESVKQLLTNVLLQVVAGQTGGRNFKIETAYRAEPRLFAGKTCALQQQSLALPFWCHVFWVPSHFIWSHRIAASFANCSLHPIATAVCVITSRLNSFPFISSLSPLSFWIGSGLCSSSQLLSTDSSHRAACNWPISVDIFWTELVQSLLISLWTSFDIFLIYSHYLSPSYLSLSLISVPVPNMPLQHFFCGRQEFCVTRGPQRRGAARLPSKTESWRCEKRSFRARLPSKTSHVSLAKRRLEAAVTVRGQSKHDPRTPETVSKPSRSRPSPSSIVRSTLCAAKRSISRIRSLSKRHVVRDFPHKKWKLKM